ncbi:MAG: MFS transporter [Actinomycetota bacterium]
MGDRGGRRLPIALGVAISTTALAVGALVIDGRVAFLIVALLVYGIGTGVALPSMRAAALDLVPDQAVGRAAGVMSMSRYAGSIPATVLIALAVSDSGANAAAVLWIAVTVSVVSLLCASLLPGRDPAPATA